MKEIDFLPQWYKDNRRRQSNYRIQYISLACLLAVMATWTTVTIHSISKANVRLANLRAIVAADSTTKEYTNMKVEFDTLRSQTALLSRIDPHLRISGMLGELAFLSEERVKFSRLNIMAETFPQNSPGADIPANTIRAVREAMADKSGPYEGDIRFKVTISGIAADATCVAQLIRRLEQSKWFSTVTPSFCKNNTVSERIVSEFEITCYIANYTEGKPAAAVASNAGTIKGDGI
jgi:Tfp pilus assembly protein PilN